MGIAIIKPCWRCKGSGEMLLRANSDEYVTCNECDGTGENKCAELDITELKQGFQQLKAKLNEVISLLS